MGGGSEIVLVMYLWGGGENKMNSGQGGGEVMYFVGFGGEVSDMFHWSFFSLKVIASGGLSPPPTPLYPSSIM